MIITGLNSSIIGQDNLQLIDPIITQ